MPRRYALLLSLLVTLVAPARAQFFPELEGAELRQAVAETYGPTSVLSEAASKDTLYAVVDRVTVGGQDGTLGLYTGLFVPFDCAPACDPSQDVYNDGSGLNQEHVWPRSLGAGSGNAERDMHHLFPSRVAVNGARGNLPFGESPDEETTAWYRLDEERATPPAEGRDAWSELLDGVRFEPREERKGDVARALFYFYAVYGPAGSGEADTAFFEAMKETLLAWHEGDPPTAEEVARSERVAEYQATGSGAAAINPFVHDATLARRAYFGRTLFVRQGTGLDPALQTGASWASAFGDLQAGLDARRSDLLRPFVREVWVAEGTYYPTDSDDRFEDFELDADRLYGGFAGTENTLEERDWEAHPTILSGDIGVPGEYDDTTVYLARIGGYEGQTRTPLIDGFFFEATNGEYRGSTTFRRGVGLIARDPYSIGSDTVSVRNCVFQANDGVALGADDVALVLEGVSFEGNRTGLFGYASYVEAEHVEWARNGYASYFEGGRIRLRDVRFTENASAIVATLTSYSYSADIAVSHAVFERHGPVELPAGDIFGPYSTLYAFVAASVSVTNARFEGNQLREEDGAPVRAFNSNVYLTNVTFVGNHGGLAGAFSSYGSNSVARLTNVTATANSGLEAGAILVEQYDHDVRVANSVLWGNGQPEVSASGYETEALFTHSLIEGGCTPDEWTTCETIVDAAPMFEAAPSPGPDGEWGTEDDDYGDLRLQEGSPAVDFGRAAFLPADTFDLDGDGDTDELLPVDLDGGPRVQGNEVDLGPYESPFAVPNEPAASVPAVDRLTPAYPNPFRSQTSLSLTVAERRHIRVEAFDVLGRLVRVLHDGEVRPGERVEVVLDGRGLPAGLYVIRATGDGLHLTRRATLVR